jgi:hypothetical protein
MQLKFNVPDYLSIKDWKYFNSLELDSYTDKMIKFLSYISDIEEDKILKLTPIDLQQTYLSVLKTIGEAENTFFPVFELDGQLYGYSSISKMTLGEYIDLEKLTKNPVLHLEEIMAILYRPIKKHSFNGIKWAIKSKHKVGTGNVENLFQYYELEEYNNKNRAIQADKMKSLPVSFALGAMSFFLALATISSTSTSLSLNLKSKEEKQALKNLSKAVSIPIGDGLLQFIVSLKHPSLASQGIMPLLT